MGPRRRLVLLLASVRDASRRTAKSAVCSAGEFMSLLSSHGPWSGSGCTMPPHNSACCMVRSSSIPGICTAGAQGACLGGTRCLSTASIAPFRALPRNAHLASCPQLLQLQRSFASGDLPPHIEMEMPALSPTMSQVRDPVLSALPNILRGLCMLQELEAHGGVPCLETLHQCHASPPVRRTRSRDGSRRAAGACRATLHRGRRVRERSLPREMCWQRSRQTRSGYKSAAQCQKNPSSTSPVT